MKILNPLIIVELVSKLAKEILLVDEYSKELKLPSHIQKPFSLFEIKKN